MAFLCVFRSRLERQSVQSTPGCRIRVDHPGKSTVAAHSFNFGHSIQLQTPVFSTKLRYEYMNRIIREATGIISIPPWAERMASASESHGNFSCTYSLKESRNPSSGFSSRVLHQALLTGPLPLSRHEESLSLWLQPSSCWLLAAFILRLWEWKEYISS